MSTGASSYFGKALADMHNRLGDVMLRRVRGKWRLSVNDLERPLTKEQARQLLGLIEGWMRREQAREQRDRDRRGG